MEACFDDDQLRGPQPPRSLQRTADRARQARAGTNPGRVDAVGAGQGNPVRADQVDPGGRHIRAGLVEAGSSLLRVGNPWAALANSRSIPVPVEHPAGCPRTPAGCILMQQDAYLCARGSSPAPIS